MTKTKYIKETKIEYKQKKGIKGKISREYSFGFIIGEYN